MDYDDDFVANFVVNNIHGVWFFQKNTRNPVGHLGFDHVKSEEDNN